MGTHRFPTSREIYNQIRWSPQIDETQFVIGLAERTGEIVERAFVAWNGNGEIPWHRIRYFRRGTEIMWDRDERINRFARADVSPDAAAQTPAPAAAPDAAAIPAIPWQPIPTWRFDSVAGQWAADDSPLPAVPTSPPALKIATWNVYGDERATTARTFPRRLPGILAALRDTSADLIALQEVTPAVLAALLSCEWVRENYCLSDGPTATTILPLGQILLSRFPMTGELGTHSERKTTLLGRVRVGTLEVAIFVVHLTSNMAANAAHKRHEQLHTIFAHAARFPHAIVLGDFNLHGDEHAKTIAHYGFADLWPQLRKNLAGPTFDPASNPLAAQNSLTGASERLDRIYFRSENSALAPHTIDRFATLPAVADDFASDHFGVCARVAVTESATNLATIPPMVQSAAVVVPPADLAARIDRIRRSHDRHYPRWMPHITLRFPFVPATHFDAAAIALSDALADVAPIEIRLENFGHFTHTNASTVWLATGADAALRAVRERIDAAIPLPPGDRKHTAASFNPHLTVAEIDGTNREIIAAHMARWREDWQPGRFFLTEVSLISRGDDSPFAVRQKIPLRGPGVLAAALANEGVDAPTLAARTTFLGDCLAAAVPDSVRIVPIGSAAIGAELPTGDVDFLAIGEMPRDDFFAALAAKLAARGANVWVAPDALQPVLHAEIAGHLVDVQFAQPTAEPDEIGARALDAELVADFLRAETANDREAMATAVRAMKLWAERRGIVGAWAGFWSGVAFGVVARRTLDVLRRHRVPLCAENLLAHSMRALATWPWPEPLAVGLADDWRPTHAADSMPVLHPLDSRKNITRTLTPATTAVTKLEFARAAERLAQIRDGREGWSAFFAPRESANATAQVCVTLDAASPAALPALVGWWKKRHLPVLLDLEARLKSPLTPDSRPTLASETAMQFAIDIGEPIAARATDWRRVLETCTAKVNAELTADSSLIFAGSFVRIDIAESARL